MVTGIVLILAVMVAWTDGSYFPGDDVVKCEYQELPCDSGQCIDRKSWCDGPVDCFDDSDEKYCRTFNPSEPKEGNLNQCEESRYFQCMNGMCIPKAGRCNDMPDCEDGEDEENCDYLYESSDSNDSKETTSSTTTTTTTPPSPTSTSTAPPSPPSTSTAPPTTPPPPPPTTTTMGTTATIDTTTTSTTPSTTTTTTTTTTTPSTTTTTTTTTAPPLKPFSRDGHWIPSRFDVLLKSIRHVVDERDALWGWGRATPRIATALFLADAAYFRPDNYDGMLTRKQVEVQLALDLMRNPEKPLRMHELVHYIHALVATCLDPHDFHGVNVVRLLKKAMARRQARGLFVNPVAYLALCNAGDLSDAYIKRIKNMAYRRHDEPRWLDVQTYALLTISCRAMRNGSEEWLLLKKDVARNISEWQQSDGGFGSIHSTGLALQALIAAEEPGTEIIKGRAMTHLLLKQDWQGSYGTELDNYYVLPALNMKSLASVHTRTCRQRPHNTQSTEGASSGERGAKKQMLVHYSLWIGGDRNEIQTLTVSLHRHSNFLQVMDAAQKLNPRFRHEVLTTGRSTSVHSIAGRASDIEKSTYWTLYRKVPVPFRPKLANVTATVAKLKLLGAKKWTKDLRKLHPRDGEHLAFWYQPYL